jgi:hypothetical protein
MMPESHHNRQSGRAEGTLAPEPSSAWRANVDAGWDGRLSVRRSLVVGLGLGGGLRIGGAGQVV